MNKILFIDLDGTIIEPKSGNKFPQDKDDWKFKKGILPRLAEYAVDHHIVTVTNQGGVADGYARPLDIEDKVVEVQQNIICYFQVEQIERPKISYVISGFSTNSPHRKPNPNIAIETMDRLGVSPENCLMVGDASGRNKEVVVAEMIRYRDVEQTIARILAEEDHCTSYPPNRAKFKTRSSKHSGIPLPDVYDIYYKEKDFSDSDAKFAENAGIKYMHVDDFIKGEAE